MSLGMSRKNRVHAFVHACVCVHASVHVCVCVCTCVCACARVCVHVCMHACECVRGVLIRTWMRYTLRCWPWSSTRARPCVALSTTLCCSLSTSKNPGTGSLATVTWSCSPPSCESRCTRVKSQCIITNMLMDVRQESVRR